MPDRGRSSNSAKVGDAVKGGIMGLTPRMFPNDEELGKKYDDHLPGQPPSWELFWKAPFRYRKRRVVVVLAIFGILWVLFLRGMFGMPPSLDYPSRGVSVEDIRDAPPPKVHEADTPALGRTPVKDKDAAREPRGPPPTNKELDDPKSKLRFYNGGLKFYRLAKSLNDMVSRPGVVYGAPGVIFAGSRIKSISALIPMACEMANVGKNDVHFLIMSREDFSIKELLQINGITEESCKAFFHDARPDYIEYSTERRADAAVVSALMHVQTFVRAKVMITDDSSLEDDHLIRGTRRGSSQHKIPRIEIPKGGVDTLNWMTNLEAKALVGFHEPSVDIMIHVQSASSGPLLHLLKSLSQADYSGMKPPRLILDLPANFAPAILKHLEGMKWPPQSASDANTARSGLFLHRRIVDEKKDPERASLEFSESFYPITPRNSHVLVLSPNVQVSPLFYHYVRYSILSYWHTSPFNDMPNFAGFSLSPPTAYLNGSADFKAPSINDIPDEDLRAKLKDGPVPFLWDAPAHSAVLYRGTFWKELHSFLTYRVAAKQQTSSTPDKLISPLYPAWMEYALELARARASTFSYPGITDDASFATVHAELDKGPVEFASLLHDDAPPPLPDSDPAPLDPPSADTILEGSLDLLLTQRKIPEPALVPGTQSLQNALPLGGELPPLSSLPHLRFDGSLRGSDSEEGSRRADFAKRFRETIGACAPDPAGKRRKYEAGNARDLFCFGDETEDDWEAVLVGE